MALDFLNKDVLNRASKTGIKKVKILSVSSYENGDKQYVQIIVELLDEKDDLGKNIVIEFSPMFLKSKTGEFKSNIVKLANLGAILGLSDDEMKAEVDGTVSVTKWINGVRETVTENRKIHPYFSQKHDGSPQICLLAIYASKKLKELPTNGYTGDIFFKEENETIEQFNARKKACKYLVYCPTSKKNDKNQLYININMEIYQAYTLDRYSYDEIQSGTEDPKDIIFAEKYCLEQYNKVVAVPTSEYLDDLRLKKLSNVLNDIGEMIDLSKFVRSNDSGSITMMPSKLDL